MFLNLQFHDFDFQLVIVNFLCIFLDLEFAKNSKEHGQKI